VVVYIFGVPNGFLNWDTQRSAEFQKIVEKFNLDELHGLKFSVAVADASQKECRIVACSMGFTDLTEYSIDEVIGRNWCFLLKDVPPDMINEEGRLRCRSMCRASRQGISYNGCAEVLPPGIDKIWGKLSSGELICVLTTSKKSGSLCKTMLYLKQVELDDDQFIVGLQAGLPEDCNQDSSMENEQENINNAWRQLKESMSAVLLILSAQFWLQCSMQRY